MDARKLNAPAVGLEKARLPASDEWSYVNSAGPRRVAPEARATRRIPPKRSRRHSHPPNPSGRQERGSLLVVVIEVDVRLDPGLGIRTRLRDRRSA